VNIVSLIEAETKGLRDKPALVDGTLSLSYSDLLSNVRELSKDLKGKGIQPLDRVALLAGNSLDYVALALAILAIPATVVPISPESTRNEVEEVLREIEVEYLLAAEGTPCPGGGVPLNSSLLGKNRFTCLKRPPGRGGSEDYRKLDPAFIRFSSGTTGKSKGVVLSHRSIAERTGLADQVLQVTPADTVYFMLSMSYHFVVTILLFLRRGATIVLCGHPFPDSLAEGMRGHAGSLMYASPFHYNQILHSGLFTPAAFKGFRHLISTTVKLPPPLAGSFRAKFGQELAEAYGIIEVGLPFIRISGDEGKRGSVGPLVPGYQLRLDDVDDEGSGEVLLKGAGMLDAYYSPWRGREELLEDGWFRTGDLGKLDDDGYLTVSGRKKNVINFSGMKIFPEEVEATINRFPGVMESMVYGEPHETYGQIPVARLVVESGLASFDTMALQRFCYENLTRYKVPKQFELVPELAKTGSGKIRR